MIESVFMMLMGMAFILFILGVEGRSIMYSFTSLMLWMITMAQSLYIHVPGDTSYQEWSLNAFALAFIFINIINIVMIWMDAKDRRRFRL